mgnify:CR=1 FL=1
MWKIFIRWWWLAAIPVIIVAGYVGLTWQRPPISYQVIMRFMAGGEPPTELSVDYDRYHTWLSSEYIARGLANVIETGTFANAVAQRLADKNLEIAAPSIQGAIVSDYAESVMVVYLVWPDAEQIVAVAEALSEEVTQNSAAYLPQMSGIGVVARRVDDPVPAAMPPSLRAQLVGPSIRLILASAVGLGLVFIAHYLDPMTREQAEVEALGIPVLNSIPKQHR